MKSRVLSRFTAVVLSSVLFIQNGPLSYAAETNLWAERRAAARQKVETPQFAALPSGLSALPSLPPVRVPSAASIRPARPVSSDVSALLAAIPAAAASVRRITPAARAGGPVVIHIQDVHMNAEAQANIGRTVESLLKEDGIGLVALEGASGPLDFAAFRAFPDAVARRRSADLMLEKNRISGPAHAALVAPALNVPVIGVDDDVHYRKNVEAVRASAAAAPAARASLESLRRSLDKKASDLFGAELKKFDAAVRAYHRGDSSLASYLDALAATARARGRQVPSDVARFLEAVRLETTLDFAAVERERTALIDRLVRALRPDAAGALLEAGVAYRMGRLSHGGFYGELQRYCGEAGVELSAFPSFRSYLAYIFAADALDAERLFLEAGRLEKNLTDAMCGTEAERALAAERSRVDLALKLVGFSLTSDEWRELRASLPVPGLELSAFEAFYEEAQARDEAMANNLLAALSAGSSRAAVLVTGGFHGAGLEPRLTRAGATVVTVMPAISAVDSADGAAYLSIFAREKTPLEKLFQGEALFLAMHPRSREADFELAHLMAGGAFVGGTLDESRVAAWIYRMTGWRVADARRRGRDGAEFDETGRDENGGLREATVVLEDLGERYGRLPALQPVSPGAWRLWSGLSAVGFGPVAIFAVAAAAESFLGSWLASASAGSMISAAGWIVFNLGMHMLGVYSRNPWTGEWELMTRDNPRGPPSRFWIAYAGANAAAAASGLAAFGMAAAGFSFIPVFSTALAVHLLPLVFLLPGLARIVFAAPTGFRHLAGLFLPLFQGRSTGDWGLLDFELMKKAVDFNAAVGYNIIQVPPLNLSEVANSPYSNASSRALDPVFANIPSLLSVINSPATAAYMAANRDRIARLNAADEVDYPAVRSLKTGALRLLWQDFRKGRHSLGDEFSRFRAENSDWLEDHMLYLLLKEKYMREEPESGRAYQWDWRVWPDEVRDRDPVAIRRLKTIHTDELEFLEFTQFVAARQLDGFLAYSRRKGVEVMIDIPFARGGADLWLHPEVFGLKKSDGYVRRTTQGVPPEPAYPAGQYWQFFPYDWSYPGTRNYLLGLFRFNQKRAAYIRLDHVLGFYRTYHFTEDVDASATLEKLGLHEQLLEIREAARRSGTPEARKAAAAAATRLILSAVRRLRGVPPDAAELTVDEAGNLRPDAMVMIARRSTGEALPGGSAWQRQFVVEKAVFRHENDWDFIRVTPNAQAGDQGFMEDYLFNGDLEPNDSVRVGYFKLAPGEAMMSDFLRLAQERGTVLVWETLGVVPPAIQKSVERLGGTNYLPLIWGETAFWGSTPNPYFAGHHLDNAYVTYGLHDSNSMADRWERELSAETKKKVLRRLIGWWGWSQRDVEKLTFTVRAALLKEVAMSRARVSVYTLIDLLGLGEEFRLNRPGVQNGQWTKRVPAHMTLEAMLAAATGSGPVGGEVFRLVALMRWLAQEGMRGPPVVDPARVAVIDTEPAVGGPVAQVREVDTEPFMIDTFIKGAPAEAHVEIVLPNGWRTFATLARSEDQPARHGYPDGVYRWRATWNPIMTGVHRFRIIVDGRIASEWGTLAALSDGADQNPMSDAHELSKVLADRPVELSLHDSPMFQLTLGRVVSPRFYRHWLVGLEVIPFFALPLGLPIVFMLWTTGAMGGAFHPLLFALSIVLIAYGAAFNKGLYAYIHLNFSELDVRYKKDVIDDMRRIYASSFAWAVAGFHLAATLGLGEWSAAAVIWMSFGVATAVLIVAHYSNDVLARALAGDAGDEPSAAAVSAARFVEIILQLLDVPMRLAGLRPIRLGRAELSLAPAPAMTLAELRTTVAARGTPDLLALYDHIDGNRRGTVADAAARLGWSEAQLLVQRSHLLKMMSQTLNRRFVEGPVLGMFRAVRDFGSTQKSLGGGDRRRGELSLHESPAFRSTLGRVVSPGFYRTYLAGFESLIFNVAALGIPTGMLLTNLGLFGTAFSPALVLLSLAWLAAGYVFGRDVFVGLHEPKAGRLAAADYLRRIYVAALIWSIAIAVAIAGLRIFSTPVSELIWIAIALASAIVVAAHFANDWLAQDAEAVRAREAGLKDRPAPSALLVGLARAIEGFVGLLEMPIRPTVESYRFGETELSFASPGDSELEGLIALFAPALGEVMALPEFADIPLDRIDMKISLESASPGSRPIVRILLNPASDLSGAEIARLMERLCGATGSGVPMNRIGAALLRTVGRDRRWKGADGPRYGLIVDAQRPGDRSTFREARLDQIQAQIATAFDAARRQPRAHYRVALYSPAEQGLAYNAMLILLREAAADMGLTLDEIFVRARENGEHVVLYDNPKKLEPSRRGDPAQDAYHRMEMRISSPPKVISVPSRPRTAEPPAAAPPAGPAAAAPIEEYFARHLAPARREMLPKVPVLREAIENLIAVVATQILDDAETPNAEFATLLERLFALYDGPARERTVRTTAALAEIADRLTDAASARSGVTLADLSAELSALTPPRASIRGLSPRTEEILFRAAPAVAVSLSVLIALLAPGLGLDRLTAVAVAGVTLALSLALAIPVFVGLHPLLNPRDYSAADLRILAGAAVRFTARFAQWYAPLLAFNAGVTLAVSSLAGVFAALAAGVSIAVLSALPAVDASARDHERFNRSEERVGRMLARAIVARADRRRAGEVAAALKASLAGRKLDLGARFATGADAARLNAAVDRDDFDADACEAAFRDELRRLGADALAPEAAQDLAWGQLSEGAPAVSVDRLIESLDPGRLNVVALEGMPDDSARELVARLDGRADLPVVFAARTGSPAARLQGAAPVASRRWLLTEGDDIFSGRSLRLADLDEELTERGWLRPGVRLWAWRTLELDDEGLADASPLRGALYTILESLSEVKEVGFSRVSFVARVRKALVSA